jgi:hypothetical protein
MRISTIIILAIGGFFIVWSVFGGLWDLLFHPPSWDIDFTYAVMGLGLGLCIAAVGLLKWFLLDWLLGFPF